MVKEVVAKLAMSFSFINGVDNPFEILKDQRIAAIMFHMEKFDEAIAGAFVFMARKLWT